MCDIATFTFQCDLWPQNGTASNVNLCTEFELTDHPFLISKPGRTNGRTNGVQCGLLVGGPHNKESLW